MKIQLVTGIESIEFEIKDKYVEKVLKECLDKGKKFDLFFPDYEYNNN